MVRIFTGTRGLLTEDLVRRSGLNQQSNPYRHRRRRHQQQQQLLLLLLLLVAKVRRKH
jgi:hypothetical protein